MLQHWWIVKTVKFFFKPAKMAVEWQQGVIQKIDEALQRRIDREVKID